ncbi:hypothetical protein BSKO_04172 [Bryopsis sp. KO-2023]|nr:hypothetical protein BSKO_04172 [Bryopsis sp. KO-2023]
MSIDPGKFSKLLKSVGYTGRLSDKNIKEAFKGREDVFGFITGELSKENLVEPEKAQRLEDLKRKGDSYSNDNPDALFDEELDEEDAERLGPWEKVENVLMPEESLANVEKDASDLCDVCEDYRKKRDQLTNLRNRLQERIKESNQRFDVVSQGALELDNLVVSAREDARNVSVGFESRRKEYDQLLKDFKDLLENKSELWFFPQADLSQFWGNEKLSTDIFTQARKRFCGSNSFQNSKDDLSDTEMAENVGLEANGVEPKQSRTEELLEEAKFEELSWFKELKAMQVNRQLLLRHRLSAKRKLGCAEAQERLFVKWSEMILKGESPYSNLEDAFLLERLNELNHERDSLVEQYPKVSLQVVQAATDRLVIRQNHSMCEEWRALNDQKKELLKAMAAQAARFKVVEYLTRVHSEKIKKSLPDISYLHHQLEDLYSKSEDRCRLYPINSDIGFQDFLPPNNTFLEQLNRGVELGGPVIERIKSEFAMEHSGQMQGSNPIVGMEANQSHYCRTPTNPARAHRGEFPSPVFSPQTPCLLTPESISRSPYLPIQTPPGTKPTRYRQSAPTVSGLCSKLEDLVLSSKKITPRNAKLLSDSKDGIIGEEGEIASEVGKMYALVFKERDSRKPSLSTSTVVDNFNVAEEVLQDIHAERTKIEEGFRTSKIQMRGDTVKMEQRMMMCNFFADPRLFHGKLLDRVQEAEMMRSSGAML